LKHFFDDCKIPEDLWKECNAKPTLGYAIFGRGWKLRLE